MKAPLGQVLGQVERLAISLYDSFDDQLSHEIPARIWYEAAMKYKREADAIAQRQGYESLDQLIALAEERTSERWVALNLVSSALAEDGAAR